MKKGRVFLDLLAPLDADISIDEGLRQMLRRLVRITRAKAGLLVFDPPRGGRLTVTASTRASDARLEATLRERVSAEPRHARRVRTICPGRVGALLRTPLPGSAGQIGEIALIGPTRAMTLRPLPPSFSRELGAALEQVWWLHRRALRIQVLNRVTEFGSSRHSLEEVLAVSVDALTRLVDFDTIGVGLLDTDRDPPLCVDLLAGSAQGPDSWIVRLPLDGALLRRAMSQSDPIRVDDVATADMGADPGWGCLLAQECRAALLVPLVSRAGVFGAVVLGSRKVGAFDRRGRRDRGADRAATRGRYRAAPSRRREPTTYRGAGRALSDESAHRGAPRSSLGPRRDQPRRVRSHREYGLWHRASR